MKEFYGGGPKIILRQMVSAFSVLSEKFYFSLIIRDKLKQRLTRLRAGFFL